MTLPNIVAITAALFKSFTHCRTVSTPRSSLSKRTVNVSSCSTYPQIAQGLTDAVNLANNANNVLNNVNGNPFVDQQPWDPVRQALFGSESLSSTQAITSNPSRPLSPPISLLDVELTPSRHVYQNCQRPRCQSFLQRADRQTGVLDFYSCEYVQFSTTSITPHKLNQPSEAPASMPTRTSSTPHGPPPVISITMLTRSKPTAASQ